MVVGDPFFLISILVRYNPPPPSFLFFYFGVCLEFMCLIKIAPLHQDSFFFAQSVSSDSTIGSVVKMYRLLSSLWFGKEEKCVCVWIETVQGLKKSRKVVN